MYKQIRSLLDENTPGLRAKLRPMKRMLVANGKVSVGVVLLAKLPSWVSWSAKARS